MFWRGTCRWWHFHTHAITNLGGRGWEILWSTLDKLLKYIFVDDIYCSHFALVLMRMNLSFSLNAMQDGHFVHVAVHLVGVVAAALIQVSGERYILPHFKTLVVCIESAWQQILILFLSLHKLDFHFLAWLGFEL